MAQEARLPETVAAPPRPLVVWVSAGAMRLYESLVIACGTADAWRGSKRALGELAGYKPRHTSDLLAELEAEGVLIRGVAGHGQILTYEPVRTAEDGRPILVHARAGQDERGVVVSLFRDGREVVQAAGQVGALTVSAAEVESSESDETTHALPHALTHATRAAVGTGPMHSGEISTPLTRSSIIVGRPPLPPTAARVPSSPTPASGEGAPVSDTLRPGEYEDPYLEAIAERLRSIKPKPQDPTPDVVEALAALAPNQTEFFWGQVAMYPPNTTSPRYALRLLASTYRLCPPSWEVSRVAEEPQAVEREPVPESAVDALTRAMWGLR